MGQYIANMQFDVGRNISPQIQKEAANSLALVMTSYVGIRLFANLNTPLYEVMRSKTYFRNEPG